MEEEPRDEGERAGYPPTDGTDEAPRAAPFDALFNGPPDGPDPAHPESSALADEADEIRRIVDGGAGSPEAIRELAARLREHREREEALWRREVKPAFVKENKGRLRGYRTPTPALRVESKPSNLQALAAIVGGMVLLVVVALSTSIWVLVLPVIGLLVWAWREGRDAAP